MYYYIITIILKLDIAKMAISLHLHNKLVMFLEEITKWVDDGSPVDVIYNFTNIWNNISENIRNVANRRLFKGGDWRRNRRVQVVTGNRPCRALPTFNSCRCCLVPGHGALVTSTRTQIQSTTLMCAV